MLQEVRFEKIINTLASEGAVKVSNLAQMLNISESTIRRDITELDAMGKLKKVFGGAVANDRGADINTVDLDMNTKESVCIEEKNAIAKYAATLIEDNDIVFIDAGTTTLKMTDYLDNKSVTYVTNGISHAKRLASKGLKVFITGGQLKTSTEATVGKETIRFLEKCNFTRCFMGANGIEKGRGLTTPDMEESFVKETAMEQSQVSYVLADNSKFGCISSFSFGDMKKACIITDRLADRSFLDYAEIREVL